jgi:hypothetical protein
MKTTTKLGDQKLTLVKHFLAEEVHKNTHKNFQNSGRLKSADIQFSKKI